VQGALDAGIGLVTATQLEHGRQFAVLAHPRFVAGGHGGLQGAQPPFDRPEVAEGPVDDLLDGGTGGQVSVLREVSDTALRVDDDLALVGPVAPGEQAQQCGLARAVLADDAGALAHGERTGDGVEDEAAVKGLGDVRNGDLRRHTCTPKHSRTRRPASAAGPGERFGRASATSLVRQQLH
jgi:hypothetical protein